MGKKKMPDGEATGKAVKAEEVDNKTDIETKETLKGKGKDTGAERGEVEEIRPGDELKEEKGNETDNNSFNGATTEEKLSEMRDKYLRLSAEFDNYRKRTLKEKMDLTRYAAENVLTDLLPVMDDFDRAMNIMENASDCQAMKKGIDLIYNKFGEFLKQNGVKEIEAVNMDFDTDLHEAVTKIPAPDKKMKGKVVDVIQKGYYLNDKVMRHSKVVIGD